MKALILAAALVATPAHALDPERREVTVISGRLWEGHQFTEMFLPSDAQVLTVMAGQDSAISFVRTEEYYWPLARQVYVDFETRREPVQGVLRIEQNGQIIAEVEKALYAIEFPEGAVNGNGRLLWGDDAVATHAAYRESEVALNRALVEAQRAQTAFEQALLRAARSGSTVPIPPPPPPPEPSLRLVTQPVPGFRIALAPGDYRISLVHDGQVLADTVRTLRVIAIDGSSGLVADILPEERWTRPIPSNATASRIHAQPGSTFYMTLAEATRFREADYLAVVSPQARAAGDRDLWVRRRPSDVARIVASDKTGDQTLVRAGFKVDQTSSSGFGYRVRPVSDGEAPDIEAFAVAVPSDGTRRLYLHAPEAGFAREIIVVGARDGWVSFALALVPLLGFLVVRLVASRPSNR